jgi:hypothetical protein
MLVGTLAGGKDIEHTHIRLEAAAVVDSLAVQRSPDRPDQVVAALSANSFQQHSGKSHHDQTLGRIILLRLAVVIFVGHEDKDEKRGQKVGAPDSGLIKRIPTLLPSPSPQTTKGR